MSDYDSDISDSDEEKEIHDLEQLSAALRNEGSCTSSSIPVPSICLVSSSYGEYSKIEAALALNRMLDEKLRRLEGVLQSRLVECRRRLTELQSSEFNKFERGDNFRYFQCGKPYFRDKFGFAAPDNEDTLLMQKSEMYDFSNIVSVPGWTLNDKTNLYKLIHEMSKENRKREIQSQIASLYREKKKKPLKGIKNDQVISDLKLSICRVDSMSLKELALPINEDYDWDYIANKLSNRHCAQEYKCLWKLYLHPSINKHVWPKSEHSQLQKIAYKRNMCDWDAIAQELGTCRTGYQCFVYFRTNMNNTFISRKWTKDEEEYLKRLIEYYREDNYIPWGKVAASMENRTKVQIYNKYSRLCELRKGKFLPEEDSLILTCVQHFGPSFRKVTEYLHGRSVTQCRDRYYLLKKKRFSAVWTIDEDRKLVQLMANQDASTNFSTISQHFPGKDRVHMRSRYLTLCKWIRRNPNVDIATAPRRNSRRLGFSKSEENLNRAIENLKTRLQSEVTDKKKQKVTKDSPEEVIDDAIVAVITNENIRMEAEKSQIYQEDLDSINTSKITEGETYNCNVAILHKLLILLKAKLNKQKFANSIARNIYQGLLDSEAGPNLVRVKSYSKKYEESTAGKTIDIGSRLDIWGNGTLGQLNYVLPPHYATITGCKRLISHYVTPRAEGEELKNVNTLIKRNNMVKAEFDILMERFNSLFLWPSILSNAPPDHFRSNKVYDSSPSKAEKKVVAFKEDYYFVLPPPDLRNKMSIKECDEDAIDLVEDDDMDRNKIDIDDNFFDTIE